MIDRKIDRQNMDKNTSSHLSVCSCVCFLPGIAGIWPPGGRPPGIPPGILPATDP